MWDQNAEEIYTFLGKLNLTVTILKYKKKEKQKTFFQTAVEESKVYFPFINDVSILSHSFVNFLILLLGRQIWSVLLWIYSADYSNSKEAFCSSNVQLSQCINIVFGSYKVHCKRW